MTKIAGSFLSCNEILNGDYYRKKKLMTAKEKGLSSKIKLKVAKQFKYQQRRLQTRINFKIIRSNSSSCKTNNHLEHGFPTSSCVTLAGKWRGSEVFAQHLILNLIKWLLTLLCLHLRSRTISIFKYNMK